MRRSEISDFLQHSAATAALAEKVRAAILEESKGNTVSHHVAYSGLPHHPTSFAANSLHARFIGRLEYIKLKVEGKEFLAGQYVFSRVIGEEEVKLHHRIRFVHPGMVVLPDETQLNLDDDDWDGPYARQIKDSVSALLLSDTIIDMEVWQPNQS